MRVATASLQGPETVMGKHRTGERTCLGCGRKTDKTELLRLVVDQEQIVLDPRQDRPGRGAYLCPNVACFALAGKKKRRPFRARQREIRFDARELVQRVGRQLFRAAQDLTLVRPEALPQGLGTAEGSSSPRRRSKRAERILKTYTAFCSGGGAECPT